MSIQDEKGILRFSKRNISYKVDVNSKESRLECIKQLRENTGRNFKWFKETTGNRHWVIYDSDMYEISNKCDTNLLGLEKFAYLHYKEESGLEPELPINATSCHCMFYQCSLIKSFTLEKELFDTTNVVTMFGMELMFNYSEKLNTLDLSSFDTSSVTDMNFMFCDCKSLTQLNLSSFSTENVKYLNSMFENCVSLWKLDLSSFSTKSAMHFTKTFAGCENLYHIDVSHKWILNEDAENNEVFNDCYRLPHYRDSRLGTEMFCSVNEGGYFHYVGEEDDYE